MNLVEHKLEELYSGVYALFYKGVCVYVGKSNNVPSRLKQHLKERIKDFDDFEIYYTLGRDCLEKYLIMTIKPFYNILSNPSKDRENVVKPDPTHTRLRRLVKGYCKRYDKGEHADIFAVYDVNGLRIIAE